MQLDSYPLPIIDWNNSYMEENNLIYFTIKLKNSPIKEKMIKSTK